MSGYSHSTVRTKVIDLAGDSLETIAEMILEMEEQLAEYEATISELRQEISEFEP